MKFQAGTPAVLAAPGPRLSASLLGLAFLLLLLPGLTHGSPQDPHLPRCASADPRTTTQPCSWFEGWYTRITDHASKSSYAVIVGTINGTGDSMVTILDCAPGSVTEQHADKSCATLSAANVPPLERAEGWCEHTSVHQALVRDATVVLLKGNEAVPVSTDPMETTPPSFLWASPSIGTLRVLGFNYTSLNFTLPTISLHANISNQRPWDPADPGAGPEGWVAEAVKLLPRGYSLPCRWFVHSLRSSAKYALHRPSAAGQSPGPHGSAEAVPVAAPEATVGTGWAHEEKNWGDFFPAGHAWWQGVSAQGDLQVVGAVASFDFGIPTPLLVAVGIRTPHAAFNLRSVDPTTTILRLHWDACAATLSLVACLGSFPGACMLGLGQHTIALSLSAAPGSFSAPILAPSSQARWVQGCSESFSASLSLRVWDHPGAPLRWPVRLVHTLASPPHHAFLLQGAALEFGEGFRCEEAREVE